MARYFYSDKSGYPTGPVEVTELQRLFKAGDLSLKSNVAQEEDQEWISIRRVLPPMSAPEFVLASQADTKSQNTTDDLLRRMIGIQGRQLYWTRMTAIVAFVFFLHVFVIGFAFRVK